MSFGLVLSKERKALFANTQEADKGSGEVEKGGQATVGSMGVLRLQGWREAGQGPSSSVAGPLRPPVAGSPGQQPQATNFPCRITGRAGKGMLPLGELTDLVREMSVGVSGPQDKAECPS
jgi:hypothetical protein